MTVNRIQHAHTCWFFQSFDAKAKCQGAEVLDSGCGDGYAAKAFITHRANKVIAYDPESEINTDYLDPKIEFGRSMPVFGDFDIAWSHHVIEHINDPIAYLKSLKCSLKDSGELWLTCPNTAQNSVFADGHIHNFTIANMVLCLQVAGFPVYYIRWILTSGQLRIRIPKCGEEMRALPQPFFTALLNDKHFSVMTIPQTWRWQNEE